MGFKLQYSVISATMETSMFCASYLPSSLSPALLSRTRFSSGKGNFERVRFSSNVGAVLGARSRSSGKWLEFRQAFNEHSISRKDNTPVPVLPKIEDVGRWNNISNGAIVCLATTLLGFAVSENVFAAVEAPPAPDGNPNLMFIIACVAEAVALTGAAVGGVLARNRKVELEKINTQLRQINLNLRRQSRVESYAPNLTYAPVGSGRVTDTQVRIDPVREELMMRLRAGKRWLREQNPTRAFAEFEKALPIAKRLRDSVEEKKTARGLGASCQRQGKYREAIRYHTMVLTVSQMTQENSGDNEAYGAIADCYTELGDLETAAKYYDRYIEGLEKDVSDT